MVEYTKKTILKDGSVKFYVYEKDPGYYYNKKNEQMENFTCPHCSKKINYVNRSRHFKTKICLKNRLRGIEQTV